MFSMVRSPNSEIIHTWQYLRYAYQFCVTLYYNKLRRVFMLCQVIAWLHNCTDLLYLQHPLQWSCENTYTAFTWSPFSPRKPIPCGPWFPFEPGLPGSP